MANVIIPKDNRYGKTRSEQEENLRKDGFQGLSDEKLDKSKYLEKKFGPGWYSDRVIDLVE